MTARQTQFNKQEPKSVPHSTQYYRTHPEYRQYEIERKKKIYRMGRNKLLNILGGQCVKCGRATDDLELDHINNDGKQDRKRFGGSTTKFLKHYVMNPDEAKKTLQILCASCHAQKHGKWWE